MKYCMERSELYTNFKEIGSAKQVGARWLA